MRSRPIVKRSSIPRPNDGDAGGLRTTMNGDIVSKDDKELGAQLPHRIKTNGDASDRGCSRGSMDRKLSSPMAPAFMVSAPGKVIVYGEHAVVHGKAAIAAAISLRSYLMVTSLSKSRRTVTLRYPDIHLNHTWDIDSLPWSDFSQPSKKKYYYDMVTSLDSDLLALARSHVVDVSPKASEEHRKMHQSAATAFLYLYLSLGSQTNAACIYTLRSTLPIGAGLGSSASVSVCLSVALLLQNRALAGPHPDQPGDEAELQKERINRWAFVGEMCFHGNPSGVDNTVSTGGKAVLFKREDYKRPPMVKRISGFPELRILLVNTGQARSTATEVAKVAALKKAHPEVTEMMLESIDKVTESARRLILSEDFSKNDSDALQHLGDLIRINHGLLVSLGVSHPKLERIRELVDEAGVGWTKLTGAGGGGCTITLVKPQVSVEALRELEHRCKLEGYSTYEITLGGDGVGVLWPAVLKNGTDEEGGEEIDQEKFLNAIGNEGVEKLVGVGDEEKREGWKFWRT